jgi:hypothetical protein
MSNNLGSIWEEGVETSLGTIPTFAGGIKEIREKFSQDIRSPDENKKP